MVVASTITTTSTSATVTSTMSATNNDYSLQVQSSSTRAALSNGNSQQDRENAQDIPVPVTTYQLLLQQVENLKMENSSLKKELKSNTSHISMLKIEASNLKDMVLMLGQSMKGTPDSDSHMFRPGSGIGSQDNAVGASEHPHSLLNPVLLRAAVGTDSEIQMCDSELPTNFSNSFSSLNLNLRPQDYSFHGHTAVQSPTASSAVADEIRRQVLTLKGRRASIMKSLKMEEEKKGFYVKQMEELKYRLDCVSESDHFVKPNDKTRQQIEAEIAKLQKTIEQSLGSPKVIDERGKMWLTQLQLIEEEAVTLERLLRKLDMTPASPEYSDHGGSCTKHVSYLHGGVCCAETSTQTPEQYSNLDCITYEEEFSSCDNSMFDVQIVDGGGQLSRPTQTVASCLASRVMQNHGIPIHSFDALRHDPLGNRTEHKQPGSIESIPSQADIDETASMHSFTTSLPRQFQSTVTGSKDSKGFPSSLLLPHNKEEMSFHMWNMSATHDGCLVLRQNGCLTILVKLIHDGSLLELPSNWTTLPGIGMISPAVSVSLKAARDVRIRASQTTKNIIFTTSGHDVTRQGQILSQLEVIRFYCEQLFDHWIHSQTLPATKHKESQHGKSPTGVNAHSNTESNGDNSASEAKSGAANSVEKYDFQASMAMILKPPMPCITFIMRQSSDDTVRGIINDLGGQFALAELFILHCRCISLSELVYVNFGSEIPRADEKTSSQLQILRKLIGFALINLTYGDSTNKATLIQMPGLLDSVTAQIESDSEELQQVMARFLRNLSWQPDETCRDRLREKSVVPVLMKCALRSKREVTLHSVLSALWNLSGHCQENRVGICSVKGALAFLISVLACRNPMPIVESAGGILRNVSSVVATNEEYRQILREHNGLQVLLSHLTSPSLTIVSNACGTLWNLSARNVQDQTLLWELGAVKRLQNLVHSKHSVISEGSSGALRNLLANKPEKYSARKDSDKSDGMKLQVRKQKNLEAFLHSNNTPEMSNTPAGLQVKHGWSTTATGERNKSSPSPRMNLTASQRRSFQETSSSGQDLDLDKGRRFPLGNIHYSGSVGSLPSSDFNESLGARHTDPRFSLQTASGSTNYQEHYSFKASNCSFTSRNPLNTNISSVPSGGLISGCTSLASSGGSTALKDVMMFSDPVQLQPQMHNHHLLTNKPDDMNNRSPLQTKQQVLNMRQYFQLSTPGSHFSPVGELPQSPLSHRVPLNHPGAPTHSDVNSNMPKIWPAGVKAAWIPGNHGPSPSSGNLGERMMMEQNQKLANNSQRLQSMLKSGTLPPLNIQNCNAIYPISNLRLTGGKCPEDLARKLQNVEEDYDNDEPPKNYSQIYKEDNMTPGIQSPRTEEIYDQANNIDEVCNSLIVNPQTGRHVKSQLEPSIMSSSAVNGPATFSDGGLSGLSSCIDSNGSTNVLQRQDNNNNLNIPDRPQQSSGALLQSGGRFPTDASLIDQYQYAEDDKPTDFGAMYSEESIGPSPYGNSSTHPMQYQTRSGQDEENGSLSNNQNVSHSASSPEASKSDETDEKSLQSDYRQDEDGKFHSGGQGSITPGHSYHHRSGRNSGMNSGIGTPLYQETPMMFSRSSSLQSLNSCDHDSIHSDVTSDPGSRLASGLITPSQLPASPSQSMPESPRRSPKSQSLLNVNQPNPTERKLIGGNETKEVDDSASRDDRRVLRGDVTDDGVSRIANGIEDRLRKLEDPGYLSSLPQKDETQIFQSNTAMSVVTTFSALTVDSNDKIQPLTDGDNFSIITSHQSSSAHPSHEEQNELPYRQSMEDTEFETKYERIHLGHRAVLNAGYITSLPTSDEIKNFVHEGSLSPMTSFSEISCLKEHNDGFQRGPMSNISLSNSIVGSRSSATGASVPPPPTVGHRISEYPLTEPAESSQNAERQVDGTEAKEKDINLSNITSPGACSTDGDNAADDDDDDDDLGSSSSDENESKLLLQACIQYGFPKKKSSRDWSSRSSNKSSASRSSSKSGKSSRSKEKSSKEKGEEGQNRSPGSSSKPEQKDEEENVKQTNPSPEVVKERRRANIKQTLERANNRLKGTHIVDYIDKLMGDGRDGRGESEGNPCSTSRTLSGPMKSKEVIGNAETLQQSYSVKKHMKETEKKEKTNSGQREESNPNSAVSIPKTTGFLPSELPFTDQSSHSSSEIRIQRFLREGLAIYNTEGTPKEMSRSTSLSNLTIESDAPAEKDFSLLQSRLKTSQSVPDFQTVPVQSCNEAYNQGAARSSLPDGSSITSSPTSDSRAILDNLSKQIKDLTLKTAESVIERPHPGYLTSLPHTDEIKKYAAEGSLSDRTVFSALTIDSHTKIAPAKPSDLEVTQELTNNRNIQLNNGNPNNETAEFRRRDTRSNDEMTSEFTAAAESSEPCIPDETPRNRTSSFLSTEDTSYATSSSKDEVTVIHNEQDYNAYHASSAQPKDEINQSSHYNNENDFLAMKERLSTYALVEGTPLNFSSNSSLSSLGLDLCSDDGNELLSACISSALPVEKKNPNPPLPNQYLNSHPMIPNHSYVPMQDVYGVPVGKFDISNGSQIPYILANSQYNPALMGMQVRGQTFISSPLQSPNDEQWAIVHKDANAIAMELSARTASPSKMSGNSQSHPTTNYYDNYYMSQGSMHDPNIATSSSAFHEHQSHVYEDSPHKPTQIRKTVSRIAKPSGIKSPADRKQTKNVRKTSRIPSSKDYGVMHSSNTQDQVKDTSSGSSSSMNQQRRSSNSKTNDSATLGLCRKCVMNSRTSNQYSCTHRNPVPVSASTVRLAENVTSHGRRRSTNSGSNFSSSFDVNLHHQHHHHPGRTSRPRPANKNVCRPSVIKLYPAMRDIVGPVGGMTDAMRENPAPAQRSQSSQAKYKNSPGSVALVKQGTFIIDKPSPVLLKHMTKEERAVCPSKSMSSMSSLSPSHSRKSVKSASSKRQASPLGSSVSLKSQSTISNGEIDNGKQKSKKKAVPPKQKHNKVWSGLKKLLSPSEEPKPITKSAERKDSKQKYGNSQHKSSGEISKPKTDLKSKAIAKSIAGNSAFNNPMESGSSLSLSSSSISNCSGSEIDSAVSSSKIEAPFGHLPKSPSLNVIQDQHGPSISRSWSSQEYKSQTNTKSVWRRTPPACATSGSNINSDANDACASSSSSIGSCSSKNKTMIAMSSEGSKDNECSPLWVLQKTKRTSPRYLAEVERAECIDPDACSNEISMQPLDTNMKSDNCNEASTKDPATGFLPPPRTQSPRVVQQVAPFNYKPSPTKLIASSPAWRDKSSAGEGRQVNSECKQTSV